MPLYEYRCGRCDRAFEKYAPTFRHQPDCPTCGASEVTRLLSSFSVSTGGLRANSVDSQGGGCGVGPPCGATACGRLSN